jgi:hypothetical protein
MVVQLRACSELLWRSISSCSFSKHGSSCAVTSSRRNVILPPDHLLLDRSPNIGPLKSRWELGKFKNCWNKIFRTSKILTLLYQQFSNLLIFQRDMSGPRLGALSNNRWSGDSYTHNRNLKWFNCGFMAVHSLISKKVYYINRSWGLITSAGSIYCWRSLACMYAPQSAARSVKTRTSHIPQHTPQLS